MQPTTVSTTPADSPFIDVDFALSRVTWHVPGRDAPHGWESRTVPWFDEIGVLDYAAADNPTQPQSIAAAAATFPAYGEPLIVRPDLAAVYWRVGSVLHSAPIFCGSVRFDAAAPVEWATTRAARDQLIVIEHNLAQCSPLPTVDPPLHVVQVDRSGRLSLSFLVADADGSPVIGPTPCHYQPSIYREQWESAAARGLPGFAAMWQKRLKAQTEDGAWRFIAPERILHTLARLGFTVTGPAAERPGLVAAFNAAPGRQWVPGWYGDSRLLRLARFGRGPYGLDGQYDMHEPGYRRIAVDEDGGWLGMLGRADVETLPSDHRIRIVSTYRSRTVWADTVALHEPVLINGPLPVRDDGVSWSATCRRCGVPLSSGEVGQFDFVPYVHELSAFLNRRGPEQLWCPAHPAKDRRRPHAPVCEVIELPSR